MSWQLVGRVQTTAGSAALSRVEAISSGSGPMQPLAKSFGRDAADVSGVRVIETSDGDEQQHFSRRRRHGRQRPLDAALELAGRGGLER